MAKKTSDVPVKESMVTAKLHKSRGTAVPDDNLYNIPLDPGENRIWLVAILTHQKYTASCCKFIETAFSEQGCTCYVPSRRELHRYPNRTKRMVTKYILPRFIFVSGLSETQAYNFVRDWPNVDIFLPDRAKEKSAGHVALAQVSQSELVRLQRAVDGVESADDITFTTDHLTMHDNIEVVSGSLKGFSGSYYHDEGEDFLVFGLGKLGNIKVRVSIRNCALKKD